MIGHAAGVQEAWVRPLPGGLQPRRAIKLNFTDLLDLSSNEITVKREDFFDCKQAEKWMV